MRKLLPQFIICIFLFVGPEIHAQPIPDYYSHYTFLMAPPGVFQDGLLGFVNPAVLRLYGTEESRFYWNTDGTDALSFNDWGFFTGVHGLGFGVYRQHPHPEITVTDYRLSLGFGSGQSAWGFGYGWSSGDFSALGRERILSTGTIYRPVPYLSLGIVGYWSLKSSAKEGMAEIGIRPFGNPRLTLFADGALQKEMKFSDAPWSAGATVKLVDGIDLIGRYFKDEAFTLGFTINLGRGGLASQGHYNKNQAYNNTSYMVRTGNRKPSIFPDIFMKNRQYLKMNLKGTVRYHKYRLFDNQTHPLLDILEDIKRAKDDPTVGAIALNLSSSRVLPEHAWEIRQALKDARKSGKKIVAFMDRAEMTRYHLASVADLVVLDPEGDLALPGYLQGLTYFKETLDKIGLGFQEWRYFKYKSAAEPLSREDMSPPDREQRQAYVDDLYQNVRSDICENRGFTEQKFDDIINNQVFILPDQAVKLGLVDTLARWSAVGTIMNKVLGHKGFGISSDRLLDDKIVSDNWGSKPRIAVVYAIGECTMDQGIKARWLEQKLLALAKDKSVKAIVFRADSPGGDGMASDLVAEAIKKCKQNKPVIVSQGQVAGSGGYWISMYGNEIIAGPSTITGSIGVIGGWLYNKSFTEKLGMTSDYVKRGDHADLGFGVSLPFTGLEVPARNLTEEEQARVKEIILTFYDDFVQKVSAGRDLPVDSVKKIAQGHFYSGLEGLSLGLVDEIGGMMTAIAVAKYKAGIKPQAEIELVEIPEYQGLIDLNPQRSLEITRIKNDPVYIYLKMVSERPGRPLPMLLPGTYPVLEEK
jgi:protease-4